MPRLRPSLPVEVVPPSTDPGELPRWFRLLLGGALGLVALAGVVGLVLAMLSQFRPLPVLVTTAVAGAAVVATLRGTVGVPPTLALARRQSPRNQPLPSVRSAQLAAAVVVFTVALTTVNVTHSAEHLFTDRDPGVHVTTARWLADRGGLLVEAREGPFADAPDLRFGELGYYDERDDGRLVPQFLHLLPVLMAEAHWIGGDRGLLVLPALLGGVALLSFFAFARTLLKPWPAVAVTAALGLNPVQVHFSRDAFTEPLTQAFLFGGLWMLTRIRAAERRRAPAGAVAAGILLGAVCLTRVEGFLLLVPLAAWWVLERREARRLGDGERHRQLGLGATALTAVAPLGLVDGYLFSRPYLDDVAAALLLAAAGLVGVAAAATALERRAVQRVTARLRQARSRQAGFQWARRALANGAAAAVAGLAATAWFVRPELQRSVAPKLNTLVAFLQEAEGVEVDGTRAYHEMALRWIGWYVTPLVLTLGVGGLALTVRDQLLGRSRAGRALLFVFLFSALLYLTNPGISPDQIWAARRFLPVVIPGVLLFASLLGERVTRPVWGPVAVAAVSLCLVGSSVLLVAPVADQRHGDGMLGAVRATCQEVGDDAAVLVIAAEGRHRLLPQTVRSFCGVPVASAPVWVGRQRLGALATQWQAQGRRLVLLGATPEVLSAVGADGQGAVRIGFDHPRGLEQTLERPPVRLVGQSLDWWVVPTPP